MAVIRKNDGFPITLQVPEQRLLKRFHTDEEILKWIQNEIAFWEKMNNLSDVQRYPIHKESLTFLNAMTVQILRKANAYGAPTAQMEFVESSGVVLSEGKQAKFLSALREDDPTLYPGAFAALAATLLPINAQNLQSQSNGFALPWTLWISGLGGVLKFIEASKSSAVDKREFERLTNSATEFVQDLETRSRDIAAWHDSQKESLERLSRAHVESFEKTLTSFRASFQDQLDRSGTSLSEFETMVRERLALEAPTKFWTEKARSHRNVAIGFGLVFLAAIGGGVFWITHFGVDLVAEAYKEIVGERENPGLLALVPLAFITLPTLAFAWILRHISRIVVQNIALQADAQLRGTIANTYTALTSQNQSTPAELAIALNALFRPIDGAGHAEIAPPNIRDILEAGK